MQLSFPNNRHSSFCPSLAKPVQTQLLGLITQRKVVVQPVLSDEGRSLRLRVLDKSRMHLQDTEGLSLKSLSTVPARTDKQVLALPNVFDQHNYSFQPWHSTPTAATWSKFF